jgi:hypothetical protein
MKKYGNTGSINLLSLCTKLERIAKFSPVKSTMYGISFLAQADFRYCRMPRMRRMPDQPKASGMNSSKKIQVL